MNENLEQLVSRLAINLLGCKKMVSIVESCTGGLISATLTQLPGSSAWFDRGFVTYGNDAKHEQVGVSQLTLDRFGAVSEQVAKEMAVGGVNNSNADFAISVTGIAGPDGGSKSKPVGTVWIGWANHKGDTVAEKCQFDGDRQMIREATVEHALQGALKYFAFDG